MQGHHDTRETIMAKYTMARNGEICVDCLASCEEVPASYVLANGDAVCDSHLEIRAENDDA